MKKILIRLICIFLLIALLGLAFHAVLFIEVDIFLERKLRNLGSDQDDEKSIPIIDRYYKACDRIRRVSEKIDYANFTTEQDRDCDQIFRGDLKTVCKWNSYHEPPESTLSDEQVYNRLADNCRNWKKSSRNAEYPTKANSDLEQNFPIAYGISVHNNVQQVERLLRLIYWPQNLYCIHVDRKADKFTHLAIKRLAGCFDNVIVTRSENVYWSGYGVLRAVLNCMNESLSYDRNRGTAKFPFPLPWKYFLNLAGQDFPLKTNRQLVEILQILNGTNDVELNFELDFNRYWFSQRAVFDADGRLVTFRPDYRKSKLPVPHGLRVYKGNLAAALTREFVEFLFANPIASDFIDWLNDTDTADEHLWATLNHNFIPGYGMAPGGYPAHCHNYSHEKPWIARYVKWRNRRMDCLGKYVRDVCIFGTGDLPHLLTRRELFANKFHSHFQSMAIRCMERWFGRQVAENRSITDDESSYYADLDSVKFRRRYGGHVILLNDSYFCPNNLHRDGDGSGKTRFDENAFKSVIKGSIVERTFVL